MRGARGTAARLPEGAEPRCPRSKRFSRSLDCLHIRTFSSVVKNNKRGNVHNFLDTCAVLGDFFVFNPKCLLEIRTILVVMATVVNEYFISSERTVIQSDAYRRRKTCQPLSGPGSRLAENRAPNPAVQRGEFLQAAPPNCSIERPTTAQ